MTRFKKLSEKMRQQGKEDHSNGFPISYYYRHSLPPWASHTELLRGSYEIGWRLASRLNRKKINH